ncbi:hypothetical protein JCM8208_002412 [Rhodotorula glutinis]
MSEPSAKLREEVKRVEAQVDSLQQLVASLSARLDLVEHAHGHEVFDAQEGAVRAAIAEQNKPVVGEVRAPEPKTFDGSRSSTSNDVYTFVAEVTAFVEGHRGWRDDSHRVRACASYLRGDAHFWLSSYLGGTLAEPEPAWLSSFELFKAKLLATFGEPDKAAADTARLIELRQTGPAWLYAAKFRHLATSLNWADEQSKHYFVRGLSESLKDALARYDQPDSLFEALVDKVTELDNRWYCRQVARQATRR